MITSRFIAFFLIFIGINLLFIFIINVDFKNKKMLSFIGCILSIMVIVPICFFPFPMQEELIEDIILNNEGLTNNFIPLRTIFTIIKDSFQYHIWGNIIYQLFGNILLFVPLGFSLYFYLEKNRKFVKFILAILFITFSIEILQGVLNYLLEFNYRCVDIDDIILNTIGGILGYLVASCIHKKIVKA